MILIALAIGIILIVAAVRNSQAALFDALKTDVPGYVVWAAAIVAVGAVGWVPGLRPVSRGLLALVILVIILRNYTTVLSGFQNAWQSPPAAGSNAQPTSGSSGGGISPTDLLNLGGHSAGGSGSGEAFSAVSGFGSGSVGAGM